MQSLSVFVYSTAQGAHFRLVPFPAACVTAFTPCKSSQKLTVILKEKDYLQSTRENKQTFQYNCNNCKFEKDWFIWVARTEVVHDT